MGAHDLFYFIHNVFVCDNFTKTSEITPKSSEIMFRGRKLQVSVEEIGMPSVLPQVYPNYLKYQWL